MGGSPFPRPAARPIAGACPRCGSEDVRPLALEGGSPEGNWPPTATSRPIPDPAAGATRNRAWRTGAVWLVAANVVLWGGALVLGLVVADTIPGWGFGPLALGFFLGLLSFGVLSVGRLSGSWPGRRSSPTLPAARLRQRAAYCPSDDCIFLVGQAQTYTRQEWRDVLASAESGKSMARTSKELGPAAREETL